MPSITSTATPLTTSSTLINLLCLFVCLFVFYPWFFSQEHISYVLNRKTISTNQILCFILFWKPVRNINCSNLNFPFLICPAKVLLPYPIHRWGTPYLTREFFHNIGSKMGDQVLLVVAEEGDELVAGALNLIGGDTLFGRLWGCHPRAYYPSLHFEACYYQVYLC